MSIFMSPEDNSLAVFFDSLISRTKWELSKVAGRDVGTPRTVDFIFTAMMPYMLLERQVTPSREELVRGYLLSNTHDDSDGPLGSRLYGEIMRWDAQRRGGVPPCAVEATTTLREEYATAHGISLGK